MSKIKIAPSILSADFSKMGEEIADITEKGADVIHLDVMDGNFVKNITFGPKLVKDARKYSDLTFDAHLMILNPWNYIERFAESGADIITVHQEACKDRLKDTLLAIKNLGVKCGAVINPDTSVEEIENIIEYCDMVLLMSVFPGFGGQKFIAEVLDKCRAIRRIIDENGYNCLLEIDGGINDKTAELAAEAGCDVLVAGSAVFSFADRTAAIENLKKF